MKNEIICPHCTKAFKIDDTAFAEIQKQVRDSEFNAELHARIEDAVKLAVAETKNETKADVASRDAEIAELRAQKESAVKLAEANLKSELQSEVTERDAEIARLKSEKAAEITKLRTSLELADADKDAEIAKLLAKIETANNDLKLSEANIKNEFQSEIANKEAEIAELRAQKESAVKLAEANTKSELQADVAKRDAEIAELKAKIIAVETDIKMTVVEAVTSVEKERDELKLKIESLATEKELAVVSAVGEVKNELARATTELNSKDKEKETLELQLKEKYEGQIKDREETIERLKDMKAKLSVKLVGENLEQHCQNEFNSVRSGQFPYAYFEKDNEAIKEDDEIKGTKGDFVYRDYEFRGGTEIISAMFEMKDEQDVSANKRTVESHLDKLDKDRKKKGLEYAVLVTLLEAENDFYNRGIVDMSYKYEKMFVIRPQFFLPLISLLKNASMTSAEDKRQLIAARNSNIDIENFVDNMESWKTSWGNNMKNAAKKHFEAIDQINKAIKDLEKVRDALSTSDKHLLAAENKMEDLTIKRLTKNAPSVAARFEESKD